MTGWALRPATPDDAPAIRALLERDALPTADLAVSPAEFIVAIQGDALIGAGALEPYGTVALLRSVIVKEAHRRSGLGHAIVMQLEEHARVRHLDELVLLTQTAQHFFEREGYEVIQREHAPEAVRSSEEFRSLCPQSAVCMHKRITGVPH